MLIPGRHANTSDYRYGFQGQELDNELKGEGNSVNYKFRMHDPRVGRFFARDPLAAKYPYYSPYSFGGNKVIQFIELEGLEEKLPFYLNENKFGGKPVLTLGLHYVEIPTMERMEYASDNTPVVLKQVENSVVFLENSLRSAWNNLATTWNDGMAGKTLTDMTLDGIDGLSVINENVKRKGFVETFSDPQISENITGGIITAAAVRKISKIKLNPISIFEKRKNLANAFYKKSGFSSTKIADHIKGIDFNKAVQTKTYKKGTILEQWTYLDSNGQPKIGNYYTLPGTDPTKLGIPLEGRVKTILKLQETTKFLQSTTSSIDDWTTPGRTLEGGGTQLFQTNVKAEIIK